MSRFAVRPGSAPAILILVGALAQAFLVGCGSGLRLLLRSLRVFRDRMQEFSEAAGSGDAVAMTPELTFAPAKPAYRPSMAITWAQRLRRVFKIDIETCEHCGGAVKAIACIEGPAVVKRILDYLEQPPESNATPTRPARAPPAAAQRDGS
jgi:hypothetical protein